MPAKNVFEWTGVAFSSKEKRRRFDAVLDVPGKLAALLDGEPGRGGWIALADVDEFPELAGSIGANVVYEKNSQQLNNSRL